MRILLVHPSVELYGADRMLLASVEALREGNALRVLLPADGPLLGELRRRGVPASVMPSLFVLRKALLRPRAILSSTVRFLRSVRALRQMLMHDPPDLLYINTLTLPSALLVGRLRRLPTLCHVHEAEWQLPCVARRVLTLPLALAAPIVCPSSSVARFVGSSWPRLVARTRVIPNCAERSGRAAPLPPERPQTLRMLLPGRWSPRKGCDVAIAALDMCRRGGMEAELVLLGGVFAGYEWYERELRDAIRALGLTDRVVLAPFKEDAAPSFAACHIVLVPSRIEPFGLVAAEGQLAGRLVVASDVHGLAEIVEDGATGRLVPVGDAAALAGTLRDAYEHWDVSAAIARAGRLHAEALYSFGAYRAALREAIRS